MYKSQVLTFGLLTSSLVMLAVMPFLNNNNSFLSNTAFAQEYDKYGDSSYSQYPTDENKYECRTGPLEGFFVSSVEFCKHVKFDDNKRDNRDNNQTGTQGPPGPVGPAGPPGSTGATGAIGPAGITQLINGSNIYTVDDFDSGNSTGGFPPTNIQALAACDPGDFVLTGGYLTGGSPIGDVNRDATDNAPLFSIGTNTWGWLTELDVEGDVEITLQVTANCFDNPPLR